MSLPTPHELIASAIEASGLPPEVVNQLPLEHRFALGDQVWQVRDESPVPGLRVFAIMVGGQHDDLDDHLAGDVRVFLIPDDSAAPYARLTLSRQGPTVVRTEYWKDATGDRREHNPEAFAKEVGAEWKAFALALGLWEDPEDEDDEGELCPKCGFETTIARDEEDDDEDDDDEENEAPRAAFCGQCGEKLEVTP